MARVTVVPEQFTMVLFDAGEIAALVAKVADDIGLSGDLPIRIEVDEAHPLGRTRVTLDPVTISVESGAFENAKRPRHLSERSVTGVTGRLLLRVRDRLDPAFGDPPSDGELTLQQHTVWDAYSLGRLARLGYPSQRHRRRYHFRIRHGFTDMADATFDRLWDAERLTWADLEAACAATAAARGDAPAGDKRSRSYSRS